MQKLEAAGAPWAIVTSGTSPLVNGWLSVMKFAQPKYLVTAEEVKNGKPDPSGYQMGAKRLGKSEAAPEQILVLEDAPAGVRAGKTAGYKVIALATTHDVGRLREAGADWIVQDMRSVTFKGYKHDRVAIEVRDALVG